MNFKKRRIKSLLLGEQRTMHFSKMLGVTGNAQPQTSFYALNEIKPFPAREGNFDNLTFAPVYF